MNTSRRAVERTADEAPLSTPRSGALAERVGRTVYPFHLGDLDLAAPENITEAPFYPYPDVTRLMERKDLETYDQLRRAALEQTGCSFCTRLHSGRALPGEERRHVRIACSGIGTESIREGLGRLGEWAQ